MVGHLCGLYGLRSSPIKMNVVQLMKDCKTQTKICHFLENCLIYKIWIPYYGYLVDSLYFLLRKGQQYIWGGKQKKAMRALKKHYKYHLIYTSLIALREIVLF